MYLNTKTNEKTTNENKINRNKSCIWMAVDSIISSGSGWLIETRVVFEWINWEGTKRFICD